MYRTIVDDPFPSQMSVTFGSGEDRQVLTYAKTVWDIDGQEQGLRYGENPDQPAAMYRLTNGNLALGDVRMGAESLRLASDPLLLQSGKHPGKINITDIDAALGILRYFDQEPCAVIVKHNNPSGVALGGTVQNAYERALAADRIAAFGGTIAVNRTVDSALAELISNYYAEVVVAPDYSEGARRVLATRPNLRVAQITNIVRLQSFRTQRLVEFKSLMDGGLIAQASYVPRDLAADRLPPASAERKGIRSQVERAPTEAEQQDMRFGWFVEAGVTSNSVIYVKDQCTVSIGTGEQDRVGVARIARDKAYWKYADQLALAETGSGIESITDEKTQSAFLSRAQEAGGGLKGATMVSDAFFPFADGALVGLQAGVEAIVQPGGSVRDTEVIDAVNKYGATMVFTGQRSFRH